MDQIVNLSPEVSQTLASGFMHLRIMKEYLLTGSHYQADETLLLNHREINIGAGAKVLVTKGFAPGGIFLERHEALPEHQAGFNFCQKGKQAFTLTGNYLPTTADPNNCNVLLLPHETLSTRLEAKGEFANTTILLSLSKYLSILGQSAEMLPKNFLNCAETQNNCYFKHYNWQPRIRQVLVQIQNENFSPLAERIFLESKLLEIIAVMLELQTRIAQSASFIPRQHEEKIRYARELLEKDLANPPTLSELARLAGTNEFTLKNGFKAIFGKPVYRFLQLLRMEKAAELLLETDLQVSEIALEVGYENTSAFTRAFKQVHGMLPSDRRG